MSGLDVADPSAAMLPSSPNAAYVAQRAPSRLRTAAAALFALRCTRAPVCLIAALCVLAILALNLVVLLPSSQLASPYSANSGNGAGGTAASVWRFPFVWGNWNSAGADGAHIDSDSYRDAETAATAAAAAASASGLNSGNSGSLASLAALIAQANATAAAAASGFSGSQTHMLSPLLSPFFSLLPLLSFLLPADSLTVSTAAAASSRPAPRRRGFAPPVPAAAAAAAAPEPTVAVPGFLATEGLLSPGLPFVAAATPPAVGESARKAVVADGDASAVFATTVKGAEKDSLATLMMRMLVGTPVTHDNDNFRSENHGNHTDAVNGTGLSDSQS